MTKKERIKLSKRCGFAKELYTDKVKKGVRNQFDKDKENSFDREAIKDIIDILAKLPTEILGEDITKREGIVKFLEYNAKVEAIQAEAKKAIG